MMVGTVVVAAFRDRRDSSAAGDDHIDRAADQLGSQSRQAVVEAVRP
jgi:hypothetical protein